MGEGMVEKKNEDKEKGFTKFFQVSNPKEK